MDRLIDILIVLVLLMGGTAVGIAIVGEFTGTTDARIERIATHIYEKYNDQIPTYPCTKSGTRIVSE